MRGTLLAGKRATLAGDSPDGHMSLSRDAIERGRGGWQYLKT